MAHMAYAEAAARIESATSDILLTTCWEILHHCSISIVGNSRSLCFSSSALEIHSRDQVDMAMPVLFRRKATWEHGVSREGCLWIDELVRTCWRYLSRAHEKEWQAQMYEQIIVYICNYVHISDIIKYNMWFIVVLSAIRNFWQDLVSVPGLLQKSREDKNRPEQQLCTNSCNCFIRGTDVAMAWLTVRSTAADRFPARSTAKSRVRMTTPGIWHQQAKK